MLTQIRTKRLGMAIDLRRCVGCYSCVIACKAANYTPPGVLWARVLKREIGEVYPGQRFTLPVLCMQCADPPCVRVCPTGAAEKRTEDGIVTIDSDACIGCRYCMLACPYGSRYFLADRSYYYEDPTPYERFGYREHPVGVVSKCDFCLGSGRLDKGLDPACVVACPTRARTFGDLHDPYGALVKLIRARTGYQLRPELGTDPSVYYLE